MASRSLDSMILECASIRACAKDWARSYGASRKSNPIDVFRARNSGS